MYIKYLIFDILHILLKRYYLLTTQIEQMLTFGHLCLRILFLKKKKNECHILFILSYSVWNQDSNLNSLWGMWHSNPKFCYGHSYGRSNTSIYPFYLCKHHGGGTENHAHCPVEAASSGRGWDLPISKWHLCNLNWALPIFKVSLLCVLSIAPRGLTQ